MARPSKSSLPVATVRKCIGKTQREFAEIVGVSEMTIRKLESGKLKLSSQLADQIGFTVGAEPSSLLDSGSTPSVLGSLKPYSAKSFESWISTFQNDPSDDPQRIIQYAEVLKEEIEILLFASVTLKHRKFRPVLWSLCQAIAKIEAKFRLSTATASVRAGDAGPTDSSAYEKGKEKAFVHRSLGGVESAESATLPAHKVGMHFIQPQDIPAFEARTALMIRTLILRETRRLSRLPGQDKA